MLVVGEISEEGTHPEGIWPDLGCILLEDVGDDRDLKALVGNLFDNRAVPRGLEHKYVAVWDGVF